MNEPPSIRQMQENKTDGISSAAKKKRKERHTRPYLSKQDKNSHRVTNIYHNYGFICLLLCSKCIKMNISDFIFISFIYVLVVDTLNEIHTHTSSLVFQGHLPFYCLSLEICMHSRQTLLRIIVINQIIHETQSTHAAYNSTWHSSSSRSQSSCPNVSAHL